IARLEARGRRTRRERQDDVVELVVERGAVDAQAAVEQVRLEAHFIRRQRLGIERHNLVARRGGNNVSVRVERDRWAWAGRGTEERARIYAAAHVARRDGGIGQKPGREAVVRDRAPVPPRALELTLHVVKADEQ